MAPTLQRLASTLLTSLAVTLSFVVTLRHFLIDPGDPYKCHSLQRNGKWLDKIKGCYGPNQYLYWQPPGCVLHEYKATEIQQCLQCKRLLFVGDSTIRQIYWATAKKLNQSRVEEEAPAAAKHADLSLTVECSTIQFLWDPFLNSTAFHNELEDYQNIRDDISPSTLTHNQTAAILVGTGLWHARHLEQDFLDHFERSIDKVTQYIAPEALVSTSEVSLPATARTGNSNLLLFAPVLTPSYQKLNLERAVTLLPEKILDMNHHLQDLEFQKGIGILWSYSLMIHHRPSAYEESGIHVVDNIATRQADVFLNMRCNSEPALQKHPFDKTCCNENPPKSFVQYALGFFVTLSTIWWCYSSMMVKLKGTRTKGYLSSSLGVCSLSATGVIGATLMYCYVADRTTFFEKRQKTTDQNAFLLMSGSFIIAGLLSITRSGKVTTLQEKEEGLQPNDNAFLSRDQSDEWKGWMQGIVLAYHYTGMSQVLWVYEGIRVLVASYLFMTGFGHTVYFYTTNDFSSRRVFSVLIRLNLLCCLLAYAMRTDYSFYYFPALTSFWFLVVYFTSRVGHKPKTVPSFLTFKILFSTLATTALLQTPGLLEMIFRVLKFVSSVNVDVHEFRFRVSLDMYVVYVGMLAATLYLQLNGTAPCSSICLVTQLKKMPLLMQVFGVVASLIILPTYFFLIQRSPDKQDYNWWHPMISPLPILAFVTLRNAHPRLRNHHSKVFAWLGRCSLETFILQYHIWLAGDTKALLSLGLFGRQNANGNSKYGEWMNRLEFFLVTIIFLWASWWVSQATTVLTGFIVGSKMRQDRSDRCEGHVRTGSEAELPKSMPRGESSSTQRETWNTNPSRDLISGDKDSDKETHIGLKTRVLLILVAMWVANLFYT